MANTEIMVAKKMSRKKWIQMRLVYDACLEAGVDVPGKVSDFFGNKPPDTNDIPVCNHEAVLEILQKTYQYSYVTCAKSSAVADNGVCIQCPVCLQYINYVDQQRLIKGEEG